MSGQTKRLVDIDDASLAAAREALQTTTMKQTVQVALHKAAASALRRRLIDRMAHDGLPDLRDDSINAWQ